MKYDMVNRPMIWLHSTKNMERFSSAVDNIAWSNIYHYNSPNEAYNYFHAKVSDCYLKKCFPEVKLSRKCVRDKMWITQGIKRSTIRYEMLF